jgi:large subunit ribosomal protein L4
MAVVNVYDIERNKVSELELDDSVFAVPVKEHLMYDVVRMQLASRRQGTASTKGRSDVSGGGKKPWRQKGTGRARVGTIRSPLWRGGGIVFGPQPRDYSFKITKKVRKAAIKSALTLKVQNDKMLVLNDFHLDEIKTKKFKEVLDRFELKSTLFVIDKANEELQKSSHNIKDVKMMLSEGINVYDILKYDNLVLLEPSVKMIERALLS